MTLTLLAIAARSPPLGSCERGKVFVDQNCRAHARGTPLVTSALELVWRPRFGELPASDKGMALQTVVSKLTRAGEAGVDGQRKSLRQNHSLCTRAGTQL
jgi:hypothetical protein